MDLFSPVSFGAFTLPNRLVMAPLTRLRADREGNPTDLMVEYYGQRASAGMIITEGTWPVHRGASFAGQPGIETGTQVEGWRSVVTEVHKEGTPIVMQIMHGGRISHPDINGGSAPEAPSALASGGYTHNWAGERIEHPVPEAISDPGKVIEAFTQATKNAISAGLDGVELHSANGYLLHQFLSPATNQRTDQYGGTPEDRARFVAEVARSVVDAVGAERVGIRISPEHNIQGAVETDRADVKATYGALLKELSDLGLAFVSVLHAMETEEDRELVTWLREQFNGAFLLNDGFGTVTTRERAAELAEFADAVEVGRPFIANPDLVRRWRDGLPENEIKTEEFYTHGAAGYTDYPFYE